MCSGPSTGWPRMASRPRALLAVLLAAACGSARVRPSPPPSMLYDDHEPTRSARVANIGASAVLTRVSPVLPSDPAHGTACASAACTSAGGRGPALGVKDTNAQPARKAARAYAELVGSGFSPAARARS